jgi:hypothetical protein
VDVVISYKTFWSKQLHSVFNPSHKKKKKKYLF